MNTDRPRNYVSVVSPLLPEKKHYDMRFKRKTITYENAVRKARATNELEDFNEMCAQLKYPRTDFFVAKINMEKLHHG